MIFDETSAGSYDNWLKTSYGRYMDEKEKGLILELLKPLQGERLLDVGCGTGEHLLFFRDRGCNVTGIDPSPFMLEVAQQKLGHTAALQTGNAEDLPFSDNEFDIVSLIFSLEFTDDPEGAIREAIRVCRGRVFLGVLNTCSLVALKRIVKGMFGESVYNEARFFHVGELLRMVKGVLPDVEIQWGSVIYLPCWCSGITGKIEANIPFRKNPFGAFLGLSFPVTYSFRAVQNIIGSPFKIKANGSQPIGGAAREKKSS